MIRELPLGLEVVAIPKGGRVTARGQLRIGGPFRLKRFIVPSSIASDLVIESVEVDGRLALRVERSAVTFADTTDPTEASKLVADWGTATREVAVMFRNIGRAALPKVTGVLIGTVS